MGGTLLPGDSGLDVPVDHAKALVSIGALHALAGLAVTPIDLWKNRLQYAKFFERREAEVLNLRKYVRANPMKGWSHGVSYAVLSPAVFSWFYETRKHDGAWKAGMIVDKGYFLRKP